ncbi:unnamed protein product [Caenorhabditis angaria]|uniref:Uncharacterized protein n=1 Tax=Caenorhabditis angaria TaxID=860376 RepID=A0A9P1IT94_9PELO|nr:unnamed protein product [Caenorhabditis angaria]
MNLLHELISTFFCITVFYFFCEIHDEKGLTFADLGCHIDIISCDPELGPGVEANCEITCGESDDSDELARFIFAWVMVFYLVFNYFSVLWKIRQHFFPAQRRVIMRRSIIRFV